MDEKFFNLELVFEKNIEVNEELKNKISQVIEENKLDEYDDLPEEPDFFNNFHKYAKIDGNSIKAECKNVSISDSDWVLLDTESKGSDLARAFKDMKIGLKLHMSFEAEDYDGEDSIHKRYYIGICESGEFNKIGDKEISTNSYDWLDGDYDGYFAKYTFPFNK